MAEWIDEAAGGHQGALRGTRVLEIGAGIASGFAARLLADHGASVVKGAVAFAQDGPHAVSPELAAYLDWNKYSVTLEPSGLRLRKLLAAADVLIVGDDFEVVDNWGLDLTAIREQHPQITAVTVTPFGRTGPRARWPWSELVLQATSGLMAISGTSDREPLMRGLRQSRYEAGLNAAYTAVAGLYDARRTGVGAIVDLSIAETISSELTLNHAYYAFLGGVQGRRAPTSDKLATGDPIPAADGFVTIQINTLIPPAEIGRVFDEPRLADPKFSSREQRRQNAVELDQTLRAVASKYPAKEFFEKGAAAGLLTGFVQTAPQLLECQQLQARDTWETVDVPDPAGAGASLRLPTRLGTMSRTPARVNRSAPIGGQDDAHLGPVPYETERPTPLRTAPGDGPLAGIRVLDLSSVFAVPYMGGLLADFGAEVIKIEPTDRLDQTRAGGFGPWFDNDPGQDSWNRSGTFQEMNRGKRSLVLNLKTERGRSVFKELVRTTDVVLDNYTPRVLRGWGLTYDKLSQLNPGIIHLSNNGYGSNGPWSSFKAQGTTLEATMGISSVCGYAPDQPSKIGQSYPDFIATWSGLFMIMSALVDRLATGHGQWIDLGMYQLGPVVIPEAIIEAQVGHDVPHPVGNREYGAAYSAVLPGARGGEWIAVSVPGLEHWARVREAVGDLPPAPPSTPEALRSVDERLTHWFDGGDLDDRMELLRHAGVANARVANVRDLAWDEHLARRGFYEKVDYGDETGPRRLIGRPYRWSSAHHVGIRGPASPWGADTVEILKSLGLDDVAALVETGVTATRPVGATSLPPTDIAAVLATGVYDFMDPNYRAAATFDGTQAAPSVKVDDPVRGEGRTP